MPTVSCSAPLSALRPQFVPGNRNSVGDAAVMSALKQTGLDANVDFEAKSDGEFAVRMGTFVDVSAFGLRLRASAAPTRSRLAVSAVGFGGAHFGAGESDSKHAGVSCD